MSIRELKESIQGKERLLKNKNLMRNLPDQGARILDQHRTLTEQLALALGRQEAEVRSSGPKHSNFMSVSDRKKKQRELFEQQQEMMMRGKNQNRAEKSSSSVSSSSSSNQHLHAQTTVSASSSSSSVSSSDSSIPTFIPPDVN